MTFAPAIGRDCESRIVPSSAPLSRFDCAWARAVTSSKLPPAGLVCTGIRAAMGEAGSLAGITAAGHPRNCSIFPSTATSESLSNSR